MSGDKKPNDEKHELMRTHTVIDIPVRTHNDRIIETGVNEQGGFYINSYVTVVWPPAAASCTGCGVTKPIGEFYHSAHSHCKKCHDEMGERYTQSLERMIIPRYSN